MGTLNLKGKLNLAGTLKFTGKVFANGKEVVVELVAKGKAVHSDMGIPRPVLEPTDTLETSIWVNHSSQQGVTIEGKAAVVATSKCVQGSLGLREGEVMGSSSEIKIRGNALSVLGDQVQIEKPIPITIVILDKSGQET